jgi:hypothetical protein
MASTSGGNKKQLVGELEQARNELHASYQGLPAEAMTRPGVAGDWSVKDVLSHVTSWEEFALPDLARLARGDVATLASVDLYSASFDDANMIFMALRRHLPLDQVLRELDMTHADFTAAVHRLPDSPLADGQFGQLLVRITAEHDKEHAGHILQWRKKEGA